MKRYSLIISNFKKKFESFVFHLDNEVEFNSNSNNNLNKFMKIKNDIKFEEQLIDNDNIQI